ncbi:hypothetical protein QC764_109980 [Podospora pseudoanserina]|uniref:Uncharacterized protein n=1 Tax=Podospora pseudoanserina TaxID=2609844 RepID=A0ABR0INN3_9PEZI|nr:hypothetical protein QC764_109980 [Podospora pseudoanserina]
MLSKTGSGVLLLQAASLLSGAAARCLRTCPADDPLLNLLRSGSASSDFCRDFLGLPVSTLETTVTPTVVATVTETSYVTEVVTQVDTTITVTLPADESPSTTVTVTPAKRDNAYPTWLPTSYGEKYISQACSCLSLPPAISTVTSTADAVTLTDATTITETTTETIHTTAIATETAKPAPKPVKRMIKIEVIRKNAGTPLGWIYNSNGPAITTSNNQQPTLFEFNLLENETVGSQLRLSSSFGPLGFNKDSHPSNIVELEDNYGSLKFVAPTEPGAVPQTVDAGKNKYASDIWSVDTETREITWQWVATNGGVPDIKLYYVSGRLYPVGDVERFMYATSNAIGAREEVRLVYTLVGESVL